MPFTTLPAFILFYAFFFFNDPANTEIYTLSLHDALPIFLAANHSRQRARGADSRQDGRKVLGVGFVRSSRADGKERSEEHTSELQSRQYLVCRLLLEKKK